MNQNKTQNQLATFIKLQLINVYGMNVYRNLKDPKEKRKKFWLGVVYGFVIIMMMFYIGALSFGYVSIGLADILPAYLIMLTSMIILMFSVFKAGEIIFQRNAYDIISALPVRTYRIVISRFVRLYVENVLLAVVVMAPAMVVFGIMTKPAWTFYVIGMIVMAFIPFIPITISVFVGALITAVSSRAKHKNLVSVLFSIGLVVVIMLGGMQLSTIGEEIDITALQSMLNMMLGLIHSIYPPAVWLGNAMLKGDFLTCIACIGGAFFIFTFVIGLVSIKYKWICDGLFSIHAKHNYKIEKLEHNSMRKALYKREFKRYFASSVYVTNTIMSPVMGLLFGVSMLFFTPEQLNSVALDFYAESGMMIEMRNMLPMALATTFCIMPITAVSISMEGKQWWIVKSLPIRTKDLLDGKLLMNLSIVVPFYLISAILVAIGQKASLLEFVWILLVPFTAILFTCIFGLTVNLKLAVFDWENEVGIVKQSASAAIGGIVPFFVMMFATFASVMIPKQYIHICMLVLCMVFGVAAWLLYHKNNKIDLLKI